MKFAFYDFGKTRSLRICSERFLHQLSFSELERRRSNFWRKNLLQSSDMCSTCPDDRLDHECFLSKSSVSFNPLTEKSASFRQFFFRIVDKKLFGRVLKTEFCLSRGSVWRKSFHRFFTVFVFLFWVFQQKNFETFGAILSTVVKTIV